MKNIVVKLVIVGICVCTAAVLLYVFLDKRAEGSTAADDIQVIYDNNENPDAKVKDNSIDDLAKYNNGTVPAIQKNDDGSVKYIEGRFTDYIIKSPVDAIYSLNSVKTIMKINSPENEFVLKRTDKDGDLVYYRLQQVFHGIPVFDGQIVLGTDNNGYGNFINANYIPITNFDTNPLIQEADVVKKVKQPGKSVRSAELVIYTTSVTEKNFLAWKVDRIDKLVFVDAKNGAIIGESSLIIN